jgi:acyl-CoA hydrolase
MKAKTPKESLTVQTQIVLPNDTNTLGNLFGGKLLQWMDIVASISAHRHSRRVVVTASVNNVSFNIPINHASLVTLEAKVSRAFSSSMEVFIDVWVEDPVSGKKVKCNEAIYDGALRRKQLSLILAGKMKPKDATELKALFFEE